MAAENDTARLSDTEGGEKPVREQLKKAHITPDLNALHSDLTDIHQLADHETSNGQSAAARGRLQRKRSFEEVESNSQETPSEPPRQHARKRSRDSTLEEDELNNGQRKVSGERPRNGDSAAKGDMDAEPNGTAPAPRASTPEPTGEKRAEATVEALSSPKTKRSRLHSTTTDASAALPEGQDLRPAENSTESEESNATSTNKAGNDSDEPVTKVPPGSGFANASAASPFSSLAGNKSLSGSQTSAGAFAASGFSALATSSASGFSGIGKSSGGFGAGGSFATGSKTPINPKENENAKSPPASSFGGALGQLSAFAAAGSSSGGFGSGSSGFSKLRSTTLGGFGSGTGGSGFGSLGGGGLTSFASGKSTPLGKPAKPFGAPIDEDDDAEAAEDDEDDKTGAKSPLATEEEKQDERFYKQELETGEEDEITQFSCRAKLYNFVSVADGKKEWRERGLGVLRFNVRRVPPDDEAKPTGRLLMRADGSHRVVLNTPVTKDIKFGAPSGGPPEGGYMYFMGTFADSEKKGGLELLQLKMKQANALDLHSNIVELQEEL